MKPLILDLAEEPRNNDIDMSQLEYSEELNLTISKITGKPGICEFYLETSTINKGIPADKDLDSNHIKKLSSQSTFNIRALLETSTINESKGIMDKDR